MRGVAILISYEVPVVLALVGIVLATGSMRMTDVVEAQTIPFLVVQPTGCLHLPGGSFGGAEPDAL